jgi:hypothetical protein
LGGLEACTPIAKDDALIASDPIKARRRDMDDSGRFRRDKLPFLPRVSLNIVRGYDVMGQPKAMAVKLFPPRYVSAIGGTSAKRSRRLWPIAIKSRAHAACFMR